ncbi:HNH endonuclease [mine drainage metagenome]|uniref:HNH endonuclease n=1 Tax=mine drainage metagenome TaxID=410659 RepID=T0YRK0_9ZZZZ
MVHKIAPFTIRLKDRVGGEVQPVRIKLDPGSKSTGIALVREEETVSPEWGKTETTAHVLFLAELTHRGGKDPGQTHSPESVQETKTGKSPIPETPVR